MGILDNKKIAFVFPGQGSQVIGMGKDLADSHPSAANLFTRADEILDYNISDICFNGPEDQLSTTINTQPALFIASAAAYEAISQYGIRPFVVAGHSVGEYAALYASGAFNFTDGLKLIRKRAELMQSVADRTPGAMAAILGLSPEAVKEVVSKASCHGIINAANFNSPIQTVISGESEAVKIASEIAKEMGAKRVVPLKVSGGFHSQLMQDAADGLKDALVDARITDPVVPVIANFTAEAEETADEVRRNLVSQVVGSVRWVESINLMLNMGVEVFIELGPGNVLAGLIKRITPQAEVYSVSDKESLNMVVA